MFLFYVLGEFVTHGEKVGRAYLRKELEDQRSPGLDSAGPEPGFIGGGASSSIL